MSKKVKKKREHAKNKPVGEPRLAGLGPLLPAGLVVAVLVVAVCGLEWLRAQVATVPEYNPRPNVELTYLPGSEWVEQEGWLPRIQSSVRLPEESRLLDDELLQTVADQLRASGWVRKVLQVSRGMDGNIRVCCDYRRPIAMVLTNRGRYIPVDKEGVRLPEEYERVEADSGWMRILGIQSDPPPVGGAYGQDSEDADAVAAVRLAVVLFSQTEIADKISGIDVSNYNGREDRYRTHIRLYTRDGRLAKWGSAIGREVEEPGLADKLRNLAIWLSKSNSPQAYADLTVYRHGVLVPTGK